MSLWENSNESLNCRVGVLSKKRYFSYQTVKMCTLDAVLIINDGNITHVNVLNSFGILPRDFTAQP